MLLARIKESTQAFHSKLEQDLDIFHAVTTTSEHGCAFFSSYGSNVNTMWQIFTRTLEAHACRYHEEDSIIDAACETFVVLSQWLLKEE
jgi:heme oxygenase